MENNIFIDYRNAFGYYTTLITQAHKKKWPVLEFWLYLSLVFWA